MSNDQTAIRLSRTGEIEYEVSKVDKHFVGKIRFLDSTPILTLSDSVMWDGKFQTFPLTRAKTFDILGSEYGFSTLGVTYPYASDVDYLLKECERMALLIKVAARWDAEYAKSNNNIDARRAVLFGYAREYRAGLAIYNYHDLKTALEWLNL